MGQALRPWQGTLLGVLAYIGMAITAIFAVLMIAAQGFITSLMGGLSAEMQTAGADAASANAAAGGLLGLMGGFMWVVGIFMIAFAVLDFFIARGLFKGQKWTLIILIIFGGLGVLGALSQGPQWSGLIIDGAVVAIAATVLKNPFYNQTK
ncbi:MAG: hypothetical protein WCX95_02210 [Candidatus Gracilibacteria bacterium]